MRVRICLLIGLFASVLLALGLCLTQIEKVHAQEGKGCENSYEIQYGDTLYSIGRRFKTDVSTLARLNGILNPNRIYAGDVLCLPEAAPHLIAPSQVTLEVTYAFTPTADERAWPLAEIGRISKRAVYPLANVAALQAVSSTQYLVEAVRSDDLPLLWLTKVRSDYVLVSVGQEEPLAALRISDTQVITPFAVALDPSAACPGGPIQLIGEPGLEAEDLTLWLESAGGVRYPFSISYIAHAGDLDQLESCFSDNALLALLPPAGQAGKGYRVVMVLTQEGFGPPYDVDLAKCESWRGRGWFYSWLRIIYGCPW